MSEGGNEDKKKYHCGFNILYEIHNFFLHINKN